MSRLGYVALAGFLTLASARSALAQRRVTGIVTAEGTGAPIEDVTVLVQGTTTATRTGSDGRFVLAQAPSGAFTLTARRIGFRQATVNVAADTNDLRITLVQDALRLQEQIVTGQATTIARVNLAHDVAVVNGADLTHTSTPTIENGLQGKVAGAQVISNSGAPGGSMQVRLRGVASISRESRS